MMNIQEFIGQLKNAATPEERQALISKMFPVGAPAEEQEAYVSALNELNNKYIELQTALSLNGVFGEDIQQIRSDTNKAVITQNKRFEEISADIGNLRSETDNAMIEQNQKVAEIEEQVDGIVADLGEESKRQEKVTGVLGVLAQSADLADEQALEIADFYPEWEPDKSYTAGIILKCGHNAEGETQLWRVVQAHTSQADWFPGAAPSLFSKIGFTESGTPIWTQPLGAHDAYKTSDKVSHKGEIWVCAIDNNVWEPGVYGWIKQA